MRIGLIRRGFSSTGGAEAYLLRLAEGLARAGHKPCLVSTAAWPAAAWPHGEIIRLPGATPSSFARAFAGVAGDFDVTLALDRVPGCDVVRAGDGVHAAWLRRRAAFEPAWKSWLRRWNPKHATLQMLEREVFRSAKVILANSRMVAGEIVQWHGVCPDAVRVIYNGFTSAVPLKPRAGARRSLGVPEDLLCALFVGSGWERKGLRTAIRAVSRLERPALLLVAGRGDARRFPGPRTKFLGPTRDLSSLFSAADAFVLPTIYDPFSNACLEALAAGLPVLTTSANGFSEIFEPGVHGGVFEPGDDRKLAWLLAEWAGRDAAAVCRERASHFSMDRNVSETIAVLEEAVSISARQSGGRS